MIRVLLNSDLDALLETVTAHKTVIELQEKLIRKLKEQNKELNQLVEQSMKQTDEVLEIVHLLGGVRTNWSLN